MPRPAASAKRANPSLTIPSSDPTPPQPTPLDATQPLLREAEALLGGPLVTYWNNNGGALTRDDAEAFRALLAGQPVAETLHFALTSTGGSGEATLRIAAVLRQHCRRLVVHVPVRAESAATMLALAADEVRLAAWANLGPVDTSIRHPMGPASSNGERVAIGQDELARIVALWRSENGHGACNPYQALYQFIHPLAIGAVDRATSLSMRICDALMAYHEPDQERRQAVAAALVSGFPSHGYPILLPEAQRIGIKVQAMDPAVERILTEIYREHVRLGRHRRKDQDERHHHDNALPAMLERVGRQVFFAIDADYVREGGDGQWLEINADNGWYIWDHGQPGPLPLAIE